MMEMIRTKKKDNNESDRHDRKKERVSLLENFSNPRSKSTDSTGQLKNRERRRTKAKAHPSPSGKDEEVVSLLGDGGKDNSRSKHAFSSSDNASRNSKYNKNKSNLPPWTLSRLMKYFAILLGSAMVSFLLLRKQSKVLHWDEYHNILEPSESKAEPRCFEESRSSRDERCSCPDPNKALGNETSKVWKSNHDRIVYQAKNAPDDLDIVFFGDDMIEQLSGTRGLGVHIEEGMEAYFDRQFTRKHGGKLNAIALGSSGDTGPNLLWHWENGVSQAKLHPKLWFIMVGGNDLFGKKCTDRFVMANVLNVAKRIFEDQPESKIVIHGITPRKDYLDSKSQELGHSWNHAQGVNLQIRKFIKTHSSRIYFMNLGQVLMANRHLKGRTFLDSNLIADGMNPTPKGMEKWGDLVKKKVSVILHGFDMSKHRHQFKDKEEKVEDTTGS